MLTIIFARDQNGMIGKLGSLPWNEPHEMRHFTDTTMGHTVVMGMNTFKSLRQPLRGRRNVVLTRSAYARADGVEFVTDHLNWLNALPHEEKVFVIGGLQAFEAFLPFVSMAIVSTIPYPVAGCDVSGPRLDFKDWEVVSSKSIPSVCGGYVLTEKMQRVMR